MSKATVTEEDVASLMASIPAMKFIVNISKEAVIDGRAFRIASENGCGVGNLGELKSALTLEDPSSYVPSVLSFALRSLSQHSEISSISRLDNFRFLLERKSLPNITVFFTNAYDVSADVVRSALDRFGDFDVLVSTNPNSRQSPSCVAVSRELKKPVFTEWRNFLGALNSNEF